MIANTQDRSNFQPLADQATEHRLSGRLDEAEKIYAEITALENPLAKGYGNEHLGLIHQMRGDTAKEQGQTDQAAQHYQQAADSFAQGRQQYEAAGNVVHTSSAMLNQGTLLLRQGSASQAAITIRESIKYLEDHADEIADKGFIDEHLGIKRARLAEAQLDLDEKLQARTTIDQAKLIPQRNLYFEMLAEYVNGKVFAAEGKVDEARKEMEQALSKAEGFKDATKIRQFKESLAQLST